MLGAVLFDARKAQRIISNVSRVLYSFWAGSRVPVGVVDGQYVVQPGLCLFGGLGRIARAFVLAQGREALPVPAAPKAGTARRTGRRRPLPAWRSSCSLVCSASQEASCFSRTRMSPPATVPQRRGRRPTRPRGPRRLRKAAAASGSPGAGPASAPVRCSQRGPPPSAAPASTARPAHP